MFIGAFMYFCWLKMELTKHVDPLLTKSDGYGIMTEIPLLWSKCVPICTWLRYILTWTTTWRNFYFPYSARGELIGIYWKNKFNTHSSITIGPKEEEREFNVCIYILNYWKVLLFPKVIILVRKEVHAYMKYCAEYFQDILLNMGYRTRETTKTSGSLSTDEYLNMVGLVDEEVREDVISYRDGWYGIMIYVLQQTLVRTNF